MTALAIPLQPLNNLCEAERLQLPVSIAAGPHGQAVVISRFRDNVWDFWPYIPHENRPASQKKLNWAVKLADGSLLTDEQHVRLLDSSKRFLWSLYVQPIEGAKRPSMTSLIHRFYELVPLLRWMVSMGIGQFSSLAGRTMAYVPAAQVGSHVETVSPSVLSGRLAILEALFYQREKLEDAIKTHPWPGESACSIAGDQRDDKPKTDLIPENVVMPLARCAINYVVDRSGRLLQARDALDRAGDLQRHRHKVHTKIARTREARSLGFLGQDDLASELVRLRTACYIVIALFAGIRDSEMMSLADCCIVDGTTSDGVQVLWLHGTLYKTGLRKKRWLVPPITQKAVEVLTSLTRPLQLKLETELVELQQQVPTSDEDARAHAARLAIVRNCQSKLFLGLGHGQKAIQVLSNATMSTYLKEFCGHHGITGPAGSPYLLHSHQFRRTYAHYVARSALGDLLMLREHFGHWSLDMTLLYADGAADDYEADTELLEWIAEQKQERQNQILGGIADSDQPVANAGDWIAGWRRKVHTAPNKEQLISEMSNSITLIGTGHSWCVGNAKGIGCGGLCVFEADMCVDCKFSIITTEHLPVWRGIRDQQLEVLQMEDVGMSGQVRAKAILLKAENVLAKLTGDGSYE